MKLRNKRTGEIGQIGYVATNDGAIIVEDISGSEYPFSVISNYKTLTKLNEDWEDYRPAEPLIKDEKIRKAVRAWAEANDINSNHYYETDVKFSSSEHEFTWINTSIQFNGITGLESLEDGKRYTIAELCGEEEE